MLVASPAFLAVLAVLQLTWAAHTQPLRASGARCCTDEASRLDTHWRTPAAGRLERQRSAPLKNKVCSSVPRKRVSHISRVSRQSRPSGPGPAKNGQQSAQHRARRVTNLEKPDALRSRIPHRKEKSQLLISSRRRQEFVQAFAALPVHASCGRIQRWRCLSAAPQRRADISAPPRPVCTLTHPLISSVFHKQHLGPHQQFVTSLRRMLTGAMYCRSSSLQMRFVSTLRACFTRWISSKATIRR